MAEDERAHERIDMLRDALMDARLRIARLEARVQELAEEVGRDDLVTPPEGDPR